MLLTSVEEILRERELIQSVMRQLKGLITSSKDFGERRCLAYLLHEAAGALAESWALLSEEEADNFAREQDCRPDFVVES